ncbi:hypothetical protein K438DRAFT_588889 [Mycena galopus ATCC 62051]|nr:hypothetical protein K438DRAFT_588889 [Mycena galopus ATCC 62051]
MPYAAHAKPAGGDNNPNSDAYAPVSDENNGDNARNARNAPNNDDNARNNVHFRFPPAPPAISSFSTLSGWAGDFSGSPASATFPAMPFPSQGQAGAATSGTSASGSTSGSGGGGVGAGANASGSTGAGAPMRTSGWYQAPGWENSVQGAVGMVIAAGDAWAVTAPSSYSGGATEGFIAPPPPKAPWAGSSTQAQQEWGALGDVEMYDASGNVGGWSAPG